VSGGVLAQNDALLSAENNQLRLDLEEQHRVNAEQEQVRHDTAFATPLLVTV